MLASSFLDTAIGIVFVFLLLSIIASTVNEIILSLLNMRGRVLLDGLKTLLNDPQANGLVKELYNHGQIFGLFQGDFNPSAPWRLPWNRQKGPAAAAAPAPAAPAAPAPAAPAGKATQRNLPSYIPTASFVMAFVDILLEKAGAAEPNLKTALDNAKQAAADAVLAAKQANDNASNVLLNAASTQAEKDAARQAAVTRQAAADMATVNLNIARFGLLRTYARTLGQTNDKIGKPLIAMLEAADNDIDKLRQNLESWYNSTMDRVSGWYKYRTQWVLFWIGLVLAISLNANTIEIVKQISTNDAVRQSLIAAAAKAPAPYIPANKARPDTKQKTDDTSATKPADPPASAVQLAATSGQSSTQATSGTSTTSSDANSQGIAGPASTTAGQGSPQTEAGNTSDSKHPTLNEIATQVSQVESLGLPIGWQNTPFVWWAPLGWLLTGVGVSLGAPFWFDLLNKFMVVRSTVKPQEKSKDEGSKD